jgi:hypothetical protein
MKNKDFQNGLIVGMISGGVVEVEDTTKLDNLETLIDNSGVLDSTEGSLSEKIEQLINMVKNNESPSEPSEPDILENYLKSSEGYVLKSNDGMYLIEKESE